MNIGTPCGSGFRTLMVSLSLLMSGTVVSPVTFGSDENTPNTLSAKEQKLHFRLWFNGYDLKGWKHNGNWAVEKGVISRTGNGGELVFVETRVPDDFELRFEWKVLPGSNSGVYYRPGQYEYQILDTKNILTGIIHEPVRPRSISVWLRQKMQRPDQAPGTAAEFFVKVP